MSDDFFVYNEGDEDRWQESHPKPIRCPKCGGNDWTSGDFARNEHDEMIGVEHTCNLCGHEWVSKFD